MAEDEDLEVLRVLAAAMLASADDESNEGADSEVEEGPHRPIVPGRSERESGFPTPRVNGPTATGCPHDERVVRLLATDRPRPATPVPVSDDPWR